MASKRNPPVFSIAIVGGGIAGLSAALNIHHHCTPTGAPIHIDVYEQASQYKEIGAGITLGINAAKLLHKLGIGTRLNAISGKVSSLRMGRFDNSEEIFSLPTNETDVIRNVGVARSDLHDLLRETIEQRGAATLHTKKACRRVEDAGNDIVRVNFADGTEAVANLVIACDGIHSAVRSQFATDKPQSSGMIAYRGRVPVKSLPDDWPFVDVACFWLCKGRHILTYPLRDNQQLNVVAMVTKGEEKVADEKESWTSVCDRQEFEDDFVGFDGCVQDLIRGLTEKPSKWKINDRRPLDRWYYLGGKVIMLGDSAHAMTPHLGAGGGQAVEDAWVIGKALKDHFTAKEDDPLRSLAATAQLYQDTRLPRAQQTQLASRAAGNTYEMQAPGMEGKSFEDCCRIVAETTKERMKRVWEEDVDAVYDKITKGESTVANGGV